MEKKLTLELIAPYLPFKLLCKSEQGVFRLDRIDIDSRWKIWAMDGSYFKGSKYIIDEVNRAYLADGHKGKGHFLSEFKPLLLPLSELTKYGSYPGFDWDICPIVELFGAELMTMDDEYDLRFKEIIPKCLVEKSKENHWLWTYDIWEKLFEWHFDVFNLIAFGVALNKLDYIKE